MDKQRYIALRFDVESKIRQLVDDEDSILRLTNDIMRSFLEERASQISERHIRRRNFLTFRRDPEVSVPSWAYRKPGTVPGFPTFR